MSTASTREILHFIDGRFLAGGSAEHVASVFDPRPASSRRSSILRIRPR